MTIIIQILFLIFTLEISFSLPLQSVDNDGLLIDLTSFGIEDGSSNPFLQTANEEASQLLKPDSNTNDGSLFVVNGKSATSGQFPYQAALIRMAPNQNYGYLICGGSLISPNYILTAAHCLYGSNASTSYLAAIGGIDLTKNVETGRAVLAFTTADIKIHEKYNPVTYKDDIAVIKLRRTVQKSAYINVIQLPTAAQAQDQSIFDGSSAVLSGFGRTKDSSPNTSPTLQYGYMTMLPQSTCIQRYRAGAQYTVTAGQECAAVTSSLANTCNGDSGGPLVLPSFKGQSILVGVVSLGTTKCESGFPSIFTRVAYYLNWIASKTDVVIR